MNEILLRIEALRKAKKKNVTQLCKEVGIAQSTYATWLRDDRIPRSDKIQLFAEYFGVDANYIMTGKDEWQPKLTEEKAALVARITKDSELLITIGEYYSLSEAMKQFVRNMVHDLTVRDIED